MYLCVELLIGNVNVLFKEKKRFFALSFLTPSDQQSYKQTTLTCSASNTWCLFNYVTPHAYVFGICTNTGMRRGRERERQKDQTFDSIYSTDFIDDQEKSTIDRIKTERMSLHWSFYLFQ